jgi:aspartate aminotransferase
MNLSKRALNIEPSMTLAVTQLIKDLQRDGKDVVVLSAGEPDFPTPEHIAQAGREAITKGFTKYPPVPGIPELREAIRDHLEEFYKISYEPAQIIVTVGAKQALIEAMLALLDPGDEAIVPVPCWVSYPEQVKLAGGIPIPIEREFQTGFRLRPEQVVEKISAKTKLIILCNPDNPTGIVMEEEDMRGIADLAIRHRFFVLVDEIYSRLVYDGRAHISFASLSEEVKRQTITVNGFSKTYAMPGWRLGYAAGPTEVIQAMSAIQGHFTTSASTISQWAGVAALQGPQEPVEFMRSEYDRRRQYIVRRLQAMEGVKCSVPQGAFYVYPNISAWYGRRFGRKAIKGSLDFCQEMINQAGIGLVPGVGFLQEGCVRISYACSIDQIEKGMDRMESFLSAHYRGQ